MHIPWRKRLSRTIRGHFRAKSLSNYGVGVVARTRNGYLVTDPMDFNVSRSLLSRGSYDWPEVCWLMRVLDQDSQIVFVGAHLGALVVPIARDLKSARVIAFEPSPHNHALLRLNIALNGLSNVQVHQLAVGDAPGELRFTENRINSGNSRISEGGKIVVATTTLDQALPEDWTRTDLLVMDTEGFEVRAMRGATESLARTRYFYVEYAPEQLSEQGSSPKEFIDMAAAHFDSMYVPGKEVRFFAGKTFTDYLSNLPPRRGLLLNLMFSNEPTPAPGLLVPVGTLL
jgi:FkbM family methyltransferase